jgi:hypothetical protein
VVLPASTAAFTFSNVAFGIGFWCTTATGASSQRPTQGACFTRTLRPRRLGNSRSSFSAPAISQESESQTRTVSGGGGNSPSFTTSKWW